jgi:hypothetical protein
LSKDQSTNFDLSDRPLSAKSGHSFSDSSNTKTNVNNQPYQIITVMNLALKLWSASTSTNRAELARRSGLWKVYFDKDRWERTQTLDRYLQLHTLPAYPRMLPFETNGRLSAKSGH